MTSDARKKLRELAMAALEGAPWPSITSLGDYQRAAHPGVMLELLDEDDRKEQAMADAYQAVSSFGVDLA